MNDELALTDSNILTYVLDISEPVKSRICGELVADCWKKKRDFAVSTQNLSEFYVVVTKKISNPIPVRTARRYIDLIAEFRGWHVINYGASTIKSAIDISSEYGIHYWDALVAATMKENDIFCIYTENVKDFRKIPWLKTINPLET